MIQELMPIFDTLSKSMEAHLVIKSLKPVARMSFHEDKIETIRNFCEKSNLSLEISDFKVLMDFKARYSTKGIRVSQNADSKGHFFLYISKKQNLAQKAKKLEQDSKIFEFGRILGYPGCCCNFFLENKPTEEKLHNDYIMPAIKNSKGFEFPFYTNIFGRYFDVSLVSHCPCSFDCQQTIKLGKKYFESLDDSDIRDFFQRILKSAVIYENGIVYMLQEIQHGRYKEVQSTAADKFADVLNQSNSIQIQSKDSFSIESTQFRKSVMVFQ